MTSTPTVPGPRTASGATTVRRARGLDAASLARAARRAMKPGRPFQNPQALVRVAVGMVLATVASLSIGNPAQGLLVTIGAFMGAIASLLPHSRSRLGAAAGTIVAMSVAVLLGGLLGPVWPVLFPVILVGFFLAGMLRVLGLGATVRTMVLIILFVALAEISAGLPMSSLAVAGWFLLGGGLMLLAQLLPPRELPYSPQRHAVSELYRIIAAGKPSTAAFLAADRSLAQGHVLWRPERVQTFAALTSLAERIEGLLTAMDNRQEARPDEAIQQDADLARQQLLVIAERIEHRVPLGEPTWPEGVRTVLQDALVDAVQQARRAADRHRVSIPTARRIPSPAELVRDELTPSSPYFQHAVRLAVAAVIAQGVGLWIDSVLPHQIRLAGHAFWVVIAAALIMFFDYADTFSRGMGRTIGTTFGALFGVALSGLGLPPVWHALLLLVLFLGYVGFRSCGQPYTMFFVVAWISSLTPGVQGGLTRGIDTIAGCLVAFLVFLVAPTWQSRLLPSRLARWSEAQADRLHALSTIGIAGGGQGDEDARMLNHCTTRARLSMADLRQAATSAALEPAQHHGDWSPSSMEAVTSRAQALGHQVTALHAVGDTWTSVRWQSAAPAMQQLENALRELPTVPHDMVADALERLDRNLRWLVA